MTQEIEAKDKRMDDLESQLQSSEALVAEFQRSLQQRDLELDMLRVNLTTSSDAYQGTILHSQAQSMALPTPQIKSSSVPQQTEQVYTFCLSKGDC